jgi:acyl-coenzyme A thioesterase PaaI-like protein
MVRSAPEPVQVVKQRRDAALTNLVASIPYINFIGVQFERRGDEVTAIMPFRNDLIGNPVLPALHGGATAAFLEMTCVMELTWATLWDAIENGKMAPDDIKVGQTLTLPKTIDFTVDYLRSGLPRDAYARARINRSGRRYASVYVEAWQDNRSRLFAQASGHFIVPEILADL